VSDDRDRGRNQPDTVAMRKPVGPVPEGREASLKSLMAEAIADTGVPADLPLPPRRTRDGLGWRTPEAPLLTDEELRATDLSELWATAPRPGAITPEHATEIIGGELPANLFLEPARSGRVLQPNLGKGGALRSTMAAAQPRASLHAAFRRRQSRLRGLLKSAELPEIGAIIDKYRIEELVGTGGFSVVYRATHLMLQMPVAIKLLQPEMLKRQPELPALLTKEARFAARINHQNVVRVYDATHTTRITYIVMEFIDGGSLADAVALRGSIPVDQVARIGIEVAAGLKAGLDEGIIHRDIKPSNVLRSRGGIWKIVDLGLARPNYDPEAPRIGGKVMVVGTPGYMAPEQVVDSSTVDFRADIYALGVTLYEAATAKPPYPIEDPLKCIEMHRTHPVPSASVYAPHLPTALVQLIQQMMAKSPRERPDTYDIVLDRLRRIESDLR
jgi:predicted Ser/Thr protein kinase